MARTELKSCFIASPVGVDTSALRAELESRDIRWIDAASASPSSSIQRTIQEGIRNTDFTCGLIQKADSPNVFYELGLASGLARKILVFVEPGAPLPMHLEGHLYGRVDFRDRTAIGFYLDTFLQNATLNRKGSRPQRKSERARPLPWARRLLSALSRTGPNVKSSRGLEELVSRLLETAGGLVTRAQAGKGARDIGADMAVWFDELEGTIRNPLLVEAKAGASRATLSRAAKVLRKHLTATHAMAGILVYLGKTRPAVESVGSGWPLILVFSADELVRLVEAGRFTEELRRQRNIAVHGHPKN